MNLRTFFAAAICMLGFASAAAACTGVTVRTKDGSVISARSLEFAFDLNSNVIMIPRNFPLAAVLPNGETGLEWKTKYAMLGLNGLGQPVLAEGINERGLSAGEFYLPGYASYAALSPENAKRAMLSANLPSWILGNFATVEEVKAHLNEVVLVEGTFPNVAAPPMPLHFRVTDASGAVIVIEYLNGGECRVFDNPIGVITNSPTLDWHLTNLRNYINLTPDNAKPEVIDGVKLSGLGVGTGLAGLPGDFTPPSRFVRSVVLQNTAVPVQTAAEGVNLALHLLNDVDMFIGVERDKDPAGKTIYGYTQWASVSDLANRKFYFRQYDNLEVRSVSLLEMNLDAATIQTILINGQPAVYRDLTHEAR